MSYVLYFTGTLNPPYTTFLEMEYFESEEEALKEIAPLWIIDDITLLLTDRDVRKLLSILRTKFEEGKE